MAAIEDFDYETVIKKIITRSETLLKSTLDIAYLDLIGILKPLSQEIRINILKILNNIFSDEFILNDIYLNHNELTDNKIQQNRQFGLPFIF